MGIEVNKHLLPMKGHYFLFNAGTSPVVPFIPVLAKQLGYSSVIVGIIYTILPIVGLISKPFFGFFGDRFHIQKQLFIIFQVVIIISFFSINFIPSKPANSEFHCHEGVTLMKFCPPNINDIDKCIVNKVVNENDSTTFESYLKCERNDEFSKVCSKWNINGLCESTEKNVEITTKVAHNKIEQLDDCFDFVFSNASIYNQKSSLFCGTDRLVMDCKVKFNEDTVSEILAGQSDEQAKSTYQFWLFFILLILSWSGMAVVVSVGDAICFEMLGNKPQRFGHQRMWGSLGWGTFSIISGWLIDKFSEGSTSKNYSIGFYLMAIVLIFDTVSIHI